MLLRAALAYPLMTLVGFSYGQGISRLPDKITLTPSQVSGVDFGYDAVAGVEKPLVNTGIKAPPSQGLNSGSWDTTFLSQSSDDTSSFSLDAGIRYASLFGRFSASGGLQTIDTTHSDQIGLSFTYEETMQDQEIVNPAAIVTPQMIALAEYSPRLFRECYGTHCVIGVQSGASLQIDLTSTAISSAEQASQWINVSGSAGGFGADISVGAATSLLNSMQKFALSAQYSGRYISLTDAPKPGASLQTWENYAATKTNAFFAANNNAVAPLRYFAYSWTSLNPKLESILSTDPDYTYPTVVDNLGQIYEVLMTQQGRIFRFLNDDAFRSTLSTKQIKELESCQTEISSQITQAKADFKTLVANPNASLGDLTKRYPPITVAWPVTFFSIPPVLAGFEQETFNDGNWLYGENWKVESDGVDLIEVYSDPADPLTAPTGESYLLLPMESLPINGPWITTTASIETGFPGLTYKRTGASELTIQSIDMAVVAIYGNVPLTNRSYYVDAYRITSYGFVQVAHQKFFVPGQ